MESEALHYQYGVTILLVMDEWQKIDLGLFDQVLFLMSSQCKRQVLQSSTGRKLQI